MKHRLKTDTHTHAPIESVFCHPGVRKAYGEYFFLLLLLLSLGSVICCMKIFNILNTNVMVSLSFFFSPFFLKKKILCLQKFLLQMVCANLMIMLDSVSSY